MSRRDMFTSVLVRELYDAYLKISRHTYDIGIIVDLTPDTSTGTISSTGTSTRTRSTRSTKSE